MLRVEPENALIPTLSVISMHADPDLPAITKNPKPPDDARHTVVRLAQPQSSATSPTRHTDSGAAGGDIAGGGGKTDMHAVKKGEYRYENVAQRFEAELVSFNDLMKVEPNPTPMSDVFTRLKRYMGGSNFQWLDGGKVLELCFPLRIWFTDSNTSAAGQDDAVDGDVDGPKTRVRTTVTFVRRPGCNNVYVVQPVLPMTAVRMRAKTRFSPMFVMDPRSYYTFKFAWRKYLNFGVSDYRSVIGERLAQWTGRCKALIEKPLQATYWLMLMVGSYYRESLAAQGDIPSLQDKELSSSVPLIHVDSLSALSALLFCQDRQVLFAGMDPTVTYLDWLRFIGDQYSYRVERGAKTRDTLMEYFGTKTPVLTIFETVEFLDLPTVVVYYGRPQQKTRVRWKNNPELVKSYLIKYADENLVTSQINYAIRLYTYCCAFGVGTDEKTYCWNGTNVCEIGVPMPNTSMSFLSSFVDPTVCAVACPVHGSQWVRRRTDGLARSVGSKSDLSSSSDESEDMFGLAKDEKDKKTELCTCSAYIPKESSAKDAVLSSGIVDASPKGKVPGATAGGLKAGVVTHVDVPNLGDYRTLHGFAAVLHGALNLAKQVVRLHFAIGTEAYHLLPIACSSRTILWADKVLPWYKEYHQCDIFQRSRYSIHLESVVRGLMGDGFTSGYRLEILDSLVNPEDAVKERSQLPAAQFGSHNRLDARECCKLSEYRVSAAKRVFLGHERPEFPNLFGVSAECCETMSIMTLTSHFEQFTQWCHSGQLVPFLQRCYRRSGISGLVPQYRNGPRPPLVLPTMADFCYGHCYNISSCFEYFYGGMKTIVVSTEEPTENNVLPDKVNEGTWLTLTMTEKNTTTSAVGPVTTAGTNVKGTIVPVRNTSASVSNAGAPSSHIVASSDVARVSQKMQADSIHSVRSSRKTLMRCGSQSVTSSGNGSTVLARSKLRTSQKSILSIHKASHAVPAHAKATCHVFSPQSPNGVALARTSSKISNRAGRLSNRAHPTLKLQGDKKMPTVPSAVIKPGQLIARDTFFAFLDGNYMAQCYPPVSTCGYSRQECRSGVGMQLCYHDDISTDDDSSHAADVCSDHKETARATTRKETTIAAGRCHETTDLTRRTARKEVKLEFCDEMRIVLGDSNWWPGAAGYRLTHEVKTDDASAYVERWAFPRAQLLYAYTQQVSATEDEGETVAEKPADIEETTAHRAHVLPPLLK